MSDGAAAPPESVVPPEPTEVVEGDRPLERVAPRSSLRERMRARKQELANRTTEVFPVPRWAEVLAVELKPIEWEDTEQIVERNSRQPKTQVRTSATEEIIEATVAFHEVKEDGELELIEDAHSWSQIAEAYAEQQLTPGPYRTRERVALTFLCGSQGVMQLNTTFRQWLAGADVGLSREVRRDFETTE